MIRAGFTIHNPLTQSRIEVLKSDAETAGRGWLLQVHTAPNMPPDIVEHIHLTWTETFTILSGTAYYSLDGVQKTAQAGDSFVVQPGQRHIHPWNAGSTEMVYQQSDDFGKSEPQAVQEVLGVFATTAALAGQGKVDAAGRPKNPLQLAAALRVLTRYGGYDASLPIGAQNAIAATLGRVAEWLGYKGVNPALIG